MTPIWLPRTWLPDVPGKSKTPWAPLAAITLFSAGLNPPTVAFAEPSRMPCCALPWPAKTTLFGAGRGVPEF